MPPTAHALREKTGAPADVIPSLLSGRQPPAGRMPRPER